MYNRTSLTLFDECLLLRQSHETFLNTSSTGKDLVGNTIFAQAENYRMLSKFDIANEKYELVLGIRLELYGKKSLSVAEVLIGFGKKLLHVLRVSISED